MLYSISNICRQGWLNLCVERVTFDELLGRSEVSDDETVFIFIDEYVLWFDVSVGDGEHGEVVESSEELVGIDFDM